MALSISFIRAYFNTGDILQRKKIRRGRRTRCVKRTEKDKVSEDTEEIKALQLEKLTGLDLNSRFEISPGIKDPVKLEKFVKELRS